MYRYTLSHIENVTYLDFLHNKLNSIISQG